MSLEESMDRTSEELSDKLNFRMPTTGSYVNSRRSVTFYPAGSNIYSPGAGTKVIRFQLNSDQWLDPETVRINFRLRNMATAYTYTDTATPPVTHNVSAAQQILRPLCGPHGVFRRLRVLCGGAIIEDFLLYNRTHEMFESLMNSNVRDNNEIEGFPSRWDKPDIYQNISPLTFKGIPGGINGFKDVSFRPLSGLLQCGKMIPLTYAPLVIELELVNNVDDCFISIGAAASLGGTPFDATNTSNSWQIENPSLKCDIIEIDNALHNQYIQHLNSDHALRLSYDTVITQQQTVQGQQNININVARAVNCLKSVWLTFWTQDATTGGRVQLRRLINKEAIEFVNPMLYSTDIEEEAGATNYYDANYEIAWQLQLGSKLYPERECDSTAQTFYQLRKALNLPDYHQHSTSITYQQYLQDKYIIGMSLEKIPEFSFSGENTKSGQLLYIKIRPAQSSITNLNLQWIYITLMAQQELEIRSTGVTVFD